MFKNAVCRGRAISLRFFGVEKSGPQRKRNPALDRNRNGYGFSGFATFVCDPRSSHYAYCHRLESPGHHLVKNSDTSIRINDLSYYRKFTQSHELFSGLFHIDRGHANFVH